MGLNIFEPLNRFDGLLMKKMFILYFFGILNINKVVSPDKNCTFAMYFTTQIFFWRFCNVTDRVKGIYCWGLPNKLLFKRWVG